MSSKHEPGAPAAAGQIALSVPHLAGREWEYIKECIDTNFVSSVGPFVDRFERELARAVGTRHAVATVNGTAALHIALMVAGVTGDDEVIMPPLTFIAPANAVRYVGGWPVFIDVEPEYFPSTQNAFRDSYPRSVKRVLVDSGIVAAVGESLRFCRLMF